MGTWTDRNTAADKVVAEDDVKRTSVLEGVTVLGARNKLNSNDDIAKYDRGPDTPNKRG
jgi:hypothetical protein